MFAKKRLNDIFPSVVAHSIKDQYPNPAVRIPGENRREFAGKFIFQKPKDALRIVGKSGWI